ncbi:MULTISPECIES: hypothetical protein [Companilactobacillus]|jgi:hypothetical protein|nr:MULTISPECIES: hypothetical protein [Companilactobacillus]KRK98357.1 hypothetical protein FC88_GL001373 [Companilactobacillus futsaii JCM 17355]MDG5113797.1 hypothetical protein [Companilactobacillus pabuli]
MMLFFGNHGDYEVTCNFLSKEGQTIAEKRICHNTSKKEARDGMREYITNRFSDIIDVAHPIKVVAKLTTK